MSTASVQGAYRNRLHTLLTNAGYNVDFVGTFSDTSNPTLPDVNHQGQGSARIDQIQSNISGWLSAIEDPDVVLLLIGTNDFWQNHDLGGVQTRLANLIAEIATKRPCAKIIVSNLLLRTDSASIEAQQVSFNSAIPGIVAQQVALGRQVSYVDLHSVLTAADLSGDGVHPTEAGFTKMGDAWFPAVASVISPQGTSNPPVIARIAPMVDLTHVSVVFSKPVADSSASPANFGIPGLAISNAVLDAATKRTITLTTSTQTPGIVYSLTVSGVRDRTAQQLPIAPGSMANFSTNALANGSFESDYAEWTPTGNQELKSTPPYAATDGLKLVAFNTGELFPNGTLSRTFATTAGQTYQLAFDFGVFSFSTSPQSLQTKVQGAGTLVSDTSALNGLGNGTNLWVTKSFNFVADSTSATLTFTDVSTTSMSLDLLLDNVRLGAQAARTLAVTSTPASGVAVTVSPADNGGNSGGTTGLIRSFNDGASVTVTTPADFAGNSFLKWQKNGVDLPGAGPSITCIMDGNHTLNAVYGSNNAPVAIADAYSTTANTQLVVSAIGVLTNDSDLDGSQLTAVLNAPPINGTLALNPNGSFTYTPATGFQGSDSFSYHANDGVSNSNVVTVSLTIYQGNSQLVVNGSFESNLTGWTATGNMVVQTSAPYIPTNGTKLLAFNAGQLTPDGAIAQSFPTVPGQTYQLAFDVGVLAYNTNIQRLQVAVDGTSSILSQTIPVTSPGNGSIPWVPQTFNFVADNATTTLTFRDLSSTTNSIDLLLDNVRVTGSTPTHTLTVASSPVSGVSVGVSPADLSAGSSGVTGFTRSYTSGTIVNLIAPAVSGGSEFLKWQKNGVDFSIHPDTSVTIDASMTLTAIYGTNNAPVAATDGYSTPANTDLVVSAPGVLANDTDADSNLLIAILDVGPGHGAVTLNPNGGFTYIPASGYAGLDSFTYHANDGLLNSNVATVNLSVTGGVPSALLNGSFESGETGWTMSGNRVVLDSTPPYIPTDGNRLMVFNGGNSAPDAVVSQTFATTPGRAYVLSFDVGVLALNTAEQRLGVNLAGAAPLLSQTLSVLGNGLGTAAWTPRSLVFTADSASTTLTFGDLSATTSGTDLLLDNVRVAELRVLTVESSPATGLGVTVSPADADGNGDGTTRFVRNYGSGGVVTLTAPAVNGAATFVKWLKNGADFSTTAATSVTVDADLTMTAVYVTNTAPVATAESYSTRHQTQLVVAAPGVLGNDTDAESNPLTAVLNAGPSHGALILDPDGGFTYTPASGYSGGDSFTYHANDGGLDSNIVTVSIAVAAPNLLVNGGFEAGETGWTNTGNRFAFDSSPPYLASEGTRFMVLNGGNTAPDAVISQSFATTPGQSYVLEFDLGILAFNNAEQRLQVTLAGASTLLSQNESVFGNGLGDTVWAPRTFSFTADSATTTLTFTDNSASTSLVDLMLDNVRVSATGAATNRTLTVTSTPNPGVSVTVSPNDLNGNGDGTTQFTRTYADGGVVDLTAPATSGADNFVKWQKDGADLTTSATASVTMDGNHTLTAVYQPAVIAPGTLVNGSFESDFTGWTISGNVFIESAAPYAPTHGTKLASFNGGNQTPNGVVSQAFATTPGVTYTLAFDVGAMAYNTNPQRLQVAVAGSGSLLSQTITVNGTGGGTTHWLPQSLTFIANSATTTLTFTDASASTAGLDLVLDNVRVTGAGAPATRTLTVASTPTAGVAITVSPADNHSNANGPTQFTRTYNDGTVVNLTAPPSSGADTFVKWQKDGADLTTSATASVTMDADHTLTAVYQPAAPVAFLNGSFESDLAGWTVTGNAVIQSAPPYAPTDGVKLAAFNSGNTAPNGVISQSFATVSGTTYTLTFDAGALAYNTNTQKLQVNVSGTGNLLTQTVTLGGIGGGSNNWSSKSFTFVANSATTTLSFSDTSTTTSGIDLLLDKVSITGPAGPAPTTATLTVSSTPATGVGMTVSPPDNGALGNGTTNFTRTYNTGAVVNLTAPATSGADTFVKWQKDGVDFSNTASASVTMDVNHTMTAFYQTAGGSSLLVNGSFESGLAGWSGTGNLVIQSATPYTATDGTNIVGFNSADSTPNGVLTQSFATTPGASYTLAFDAGVLSYTTASQKMQVAVTGTGSLLSQTVTVTRTSGSNNLWLPQSFVFVANNTTSTVSFTDISATTSGLDLVLDNVRVTLNSGVPVLRTLTVNSTPVSANITASPIDANGNGNGTTDFGRSYATGSVVNLTAPATSGGVSFLKWRKNGVDLTTSATTSVTMDASHTLTAVYADPPFSNGSFETGTFAPWTTSGGTVDSVRINSIIGGTDGSRIVEFNSANSPSGGILTQAFLTTPGVTYNLSFDLGVLAFNTSPQTLQVTVIGTGSLLSQTATISGINNGTVKWEARNYSFTANSDTTTLTFTDTSAVTGAIDMLLDNVRVTNANARTLTVDSVVASSVAMTVSPSDINGNGSGATRLTRTFNLGTSVTLTAPATSSSGATFVKWVKDGVDFAVTPTTSVTLSADTSMFAVYSGGSSAPLGPNLLQNHSFEASPDLASWSHSGSTRIEMPGAGSGFPTDGNNILSFNVGGEPNNGTVSQGFATTAGTTYTVQLDVGVHGGIGGAAIDQTLNIKAIGNAILLNRNATVHGSSTVFVWAAQTYTFVADSPTTTLHLSDVSSTGAGTDLFVDNVRVKSGTLAPSILTVNSTPATGKTVTVSPVDLASQGDGSTDFTRIHNTGTSVTLAAPYANFVKWLKDGAWYATNPTTTVLVDGNHTMTAVYTTTPVLGPFTNGSFESEFTGWTWSGSQQSVKIKDGLPSTDGLFVIEFNSNNSANDGSLSQTFTTTPGTTYTVDFDMGIFASSSAQQQSLKCQLTGTGSLASQTFSINGLDSGGVVYAPKSVTFTANSATTTLTFSDQSSYGNGLDLLLDNVRVTASAAPAAIPLLTQAAPQIAPEPAIAPITAQPGPQTLGGIPTLSGTPGAFRIAMNAAETGWYILERSEDLKTWHFHSKIQVTAPGRVEFNDNAPPKPRMFYRIGRQPGVPNN